jgi:hypothetical protein
MKLYSSGSVCNSIQVPRRICGSVESVLIVAIAAIERLRQRARAVRVTGE